MAQARDKLKLRKGPVFLKAGLKRLRQEQDTWEADFRALPKAITQAATHHRGMVISKPHGLLLAEIQVDGKPSVIDLATLLVNAMRHPLTGRAHRPSRVHVRGHHQWRELFPPLERLGIEFVIQHKFPKINEAYQEYLRQLRAVAPVGKSNPREMKAKVDELFPAIAQYVEGYGHIEIGDQETFGFCVRALEYGGLVWEDDKPNTLAEAMAALEKRLAQWFREQGIELRNSSKKS